MSSVVIKGDTSGQVTLDAPAIAGTVAVTLPSASGTMATTGDVIGVNQTWQDVTGSRTAGTTYTNSTGKPIMVNIRPSVANGVNGSGSITVSGTTVASFASFVSATTPPMSTMSVIVPNGATYSLTLSSASLTLWAELR